MSTLFQRMQAAMEPVPPLERGIKTAQAVTHWLPFDQFMRMALYEPMLGYYTSGRPTFGGMPQVGMKGQGSDFVTAPEMSPLFGRALAAQLQQALAHTQTHEIWEFGAGSGALAEQLLQTLHPLAGALKGVTYHIVELSATLRQRQQLRLQAWSHCVHWHDQLPAAIQGVVVGNEVLDALPVKVLSRINGHWHERGVVLNADGTAWQWLDVPTTLRPPVEIEGQHDYVTEIHPQARGLMNTLARTVQQGAVFWIDYGFPELEYYHPQRSMGTLVCHHLHQVDADPLTLVGQKDITAHVNFTDVAMAAQDADWQVLGYTSQGRFLINCGLLWLLESADLATRSNAARLVNEHEMGELFKVIAMAPASCATGWVPCGFQVGDRTHTL